MLVQQVLYLLFVHLDLHLVALFHLLHLPVLVPQLSLLLLQLLLRDLPEGVDLVSLQLEVVSLFHLLPQPIFHVMDLTLQLLHALPLQPVVLRRTLFSLPLLASLLPPLLPSLLLRHSSSQHRVQAQGTAGHQLKLAQYSPVLHLLPVVEDPQPITGDFFALLELLLDPRDAVIFADPERYRDTMQVSNEDLHAAGFLPTSLRGQP
mmetsp:Transcript_24405/g.55011  ORF Transcript_24405/g.55011 Transcript_24405/m.55011 type:complete len:206 (+) Transcript_24405:1131-1748(+)